MYCLYSQNPLIEKEDKSLFEMDTSGQIYSNGDCHGIHRPEEPLGDKPTKLVPQYNFPKFVDAGTIDRYEQSLHGGQNNNRSPAQRQDTDSRRFQNELENKHRELNQKKAHPRQEEKDDYVLMVAESADLPSSRAEEEVPTNTQSESRHQLRKKNHKLKKELHQTRRMLECERSQKNALQERQKELESQVIHLRRSQSEDDSLETYSKRIRELQNEVRGYKSELEGERSKGQKVQIEIEVVKKQNRKCQEKMRLLMFHHIPNASTKFKDIGSVDHEVQESLGHVAGYQLGKKLGEGHYGMVQVGTSLLTKKGFAVKVLNKARINRFKDLQQVAMEVHVLKNYPHPNIIHLQEVVHAPDNLYLMTELCLMDLHKYHKDIGLSEAGAKEVILGILKPLHHLHSHGICHLDLKPENVLLARSVDLHNVTHENVRLCDFGLVNMAKKPEECKDIVRKGYACGTPGFFAPEMILQNEFEGRQADMWSLGCIILELTLGFTQEWIESYAHIESKPDAFQEGLETCLEEISPDVYPHNQKLLDIMHRCLTIDPTPRINSTNALGHPWLEEIVVDDEDRQDYTHSRLSVRKSSTVYAERSVLVACPTSMSVGY
jgi:hypothetical protein